MNTYVITVSKTFPASHSKKGHPTLFVRHILNGIKIHTIRSNYELWAKRFKKIESGEACLSIRYWTDKPYRSPQKEFLKLTKDDGIGIQKIVWNGRYGVVENNTSVTNYKIATNDGLLLPHFKEWFKGAAAQPMAVIHFTDFRY